VQILDASIRGVPPAALGVLPDTPGAQTEARRVSKE
jgi:hypothetical protein